MYASLAPNRFILFEAKEERKCLNWTSKWLRNFDGYPISKHALYHGETLMEKPSIIINEPFAANGYMVQKNSCWIPKLRTGTFKNKRSLAYIQ